MQERRKIRPPTAKRGRCSDAACVHNNGPRLVAWSTDPDAMLSNHATHDAAACRRVSDGAGAGLALIAPPVSIGRAPSADNHFAGGRGRGDSRSGRRPRVHVAVPLGARVFEFDGYGVKPAVANTALCND